MEITHGLLIFYACALTCIDALMFQLSPNQKKCLKEEIHKDVLVTGEYDISDAIGQTAALKVGYCSY